MGRRQVRMVGFAPSPSLERPVASPSKDDDDDDEDSKDGASSSGDDEMMTSQ